MDYLHEQSPPHRWIDDPRAGRTHADRRRPADGDAFAPGGHLDRTTPGRDRFRSRYATGSSYSRIGRTAGPKQRLTWTLTAICQADATNCVLAGGNAIR